jgi:SGNH hydrolase-like domain, acetyltransferase AlgX
MSARTSAARPPAVTDRPPRYEGALQGVGNGVALGWAIDRANPQARVSVSVVVDGEIAATGVADITRPDLATLDLGDDAHGFMVALPEHLQTPARHRILVLAGAEQVAIPAAPSFWHRPSVDGAWSDVVFEPGGMLSARVPDPPPPRERRALVAKGWLCDADELTERSPVGEDRLDQISAALTKAANACAALGIAYVPALIPRKRDVLAGPPPGERAWIEQLGARLRDLDHLELLDLLPVLRDAARYGSAYHRTDADWNDRGAFFAARALLKEAHKRIPALCPPAVSELRLRQIPAYRGTLVDVPKVQLLAGELVPCELEIEAEHGVVIDPSELHALRMPVERNLAEVGSTHLRVYAAPEQDDHARLALIGDSAALALVPWLAERTSRTTFFWTPDLPLDQLELELPPIVLQLLRETDLRGGPLPDVLHGALTAGAAIANGHNGAAPETQRRVLPPVIQNGAGPASGGTRAPAADPAPLVDKPLDTPASGLATLVSGLSAVAIRGIATGTRETTRRTGAALRANVWTIALVGLLTALSWPFTYVKGGAGLDNSWVVGLSFAVAHGLAFGRQVIFTYGPLGFSLVPAAITPGTFLAGEALGGLIQLALVAVLLANLRLRMNLLAASLLTLLAASLVGWVEAEPLSGIAFGLVALTYAMPPLRREQAFRRLAIGGGAFAGFAILVKLNDGVATGAIIAIGLLGGDWRRRNLSQAATSMLGTLVALWLLLGEPLGALPDYLHNSYDVVTGYVEAMGREAGPEIQWQLLVVMGSAIALAIGASRAFATERRRRGTALAAAVLVVHYFVAREAFVRYDSGHVAVIALLSAVALMIPWPRAQRSTGLALAAMLAVAAFAVLTRPVTEIIDPPGDAHQLARQVREVLDPAALIAEGRAGVQRDDAIPMAMAHTLDGHCVTAEPDEIAAVWAHQPWRWCPLPVFQSYTANTSRLDKLNAAAYADAHHGPDRVLRQVDQAIDERNPIWESPAAMLSMLCHFTEIEHSGEWQTLARIPNRCGNPYDLETIHSSLGRTITLPSPPANAVLVAAINGVQVAGWERLETLFTRAKDRFVTVNGQSDLRFRVPPGTADDGLILAVPSYADYAAPFNLNMAPRTLQVVVEDHNSGPIAVRLFAVPIAHPAAFTSAPTNPGASEGSGSVASQGFRADTHHLPWLYEGQKLLAPQQILSLPEADRELADSALLNAETIPLEQPNSKELRAAAPVVPIRRSPAMHIERTPIAGTSHGCTLLRPSTPGEVAVVSVTPAHGLYLSMPATGSLSIYVHRYAKHVSANPLHLLPSAGTPAIMRFPPDASTRPWHVRLAPTTPTAVCLV